MSENGQDPTKIAFFEDLKFTEQVVLGASLLETPATDKVISVLNKDSFYFEEHRIIFKAIETLYDEGSPVDIITIASHLRKTGELNKSGGAVYITELTNRINNTASIEYYCRLVAEFSIRTEAWKIGQNLVKTTSKEEGDVFDIVEGVIRKLEDLKSMYVKKDYKSGGELFKETVYEIENKKSDESGISGIPSGFIAIDKILGGFQNTDLIIIAARPGQGKTALAVSMINNFLAVFGNKVGFFSLEMSDIQIAMRMMSAISAIEHSQLRNGKLSGEDWEKLLHHITPLTENTFCLDDSGSLMLSDFKAKARKMKDEEGIEIILVDYLQLMRDKGKGNFEQEISNISAGLKQVAKDLNIPVIALAQLSRAVEMRGGDKRPVLSDLRSSGQIEANADIVAFLYRPEYYGVTLDELGYSTIGKAEFIIAKHRNGETGNVNLNFQGHYTRFTDSGYNNSGREDTPF